MMDTKQKETGNKIAKMFFLVTAVYLGMKFLFPIVLPFLAAFVLARFLYPLARALEKKAGLKQELSRFLAYGAFLMGIGLIAAAFFYLCYRMGSRSLSHLDEWKTGADQIFCRCCERLEQRVGFSAEKIRETVEQGASAFAGGAVAYSKDASLNMLGFFARSFVAFVATFLILNDYEKIMGGLVKTQAGKQIRDMLREMKAASGAYVKAQLSIMGIVTAVCIVGLLVLRIPCAIWLGLAIGLFDALPFFGTGSVFVPWAVVCLLLGSYEIAIGCLCLYILCSFIRQFLEPKLVGKRLGVPPLAVLMSIYIGIRVYGGIGILSGPLSALLLYEAVRLSESHLTEG